MDRCSSCGAVLAAGAAWCGQCFAAAATAPTAAPSALTAQPAAPVTWAGPSVPAASAEGLTRNSRWVKTDTTFGPLGRLLATFALVVPLAIMVVGGVADPFVWGGAAVWGAVIMPWGLRDVWKAGRVTVG
jgi:hypothetical protein